MNVAPKLPWWHVRRDPLLALLGERDCAYVYNLPTVRSQAAELREIHSVSRVLYALKANPHPEILRTVHASGCGFECVSRAEIERVLESVPGIGREAVLFTPNFAPRAEYRWALELGFQVTVDNLSILRDWRSLFTGREIFLRLDATGGHGHHEKVRTGGMRRGKLHPDCLPIPPIVRIGVAWHRSVLRRPEGLPGASPPSTASG